MRRLSKVDISKEKMNAKQTQPEYGNWVSKRFVYFPLGIGVVLICLAFLFPTILILAVLSLLASAYFAYARFKFSPRGGDVQCKIRALVLSNLDWDGTGRALDIGCGNGALTIMLAKKYPNSLVTGVDSWGKNWEYSKDKCEENAKVEGVIDRITFQKASASSLPYPNEYFDVVVSNLTFHEVSGTPDKRELLKEALRVAKNGARFSFQDLFLIKRAYGDTDDLVRTLKGWGLKKVEFVPTRDSQFIPKLLKLPFMVGTMGIIAGEK
jgi:SAM-dependent methyltransferase